MSKVILGIFHHSKQLIYFKYISFPIFFLFNKLSHRAIFLSINLDSRQEEIYFRKHGPYLEVPRKIKKATQKKNQMGAHDGLRFFNDVLLGYLLLTSFILQSELYFLVIKRSFKYHQVHIFTNKLSAHHAHTYQIVSLANQSKLYHCLA